MTTAHERRLAAEGRRATLGAWYTPPELVEWVLDAVDGSPARVLDPACGDGNFLAAAARRWPEAELVGYDVDADALALAQARVPRARLLHGNGLEASGQFDAVVGNPPFLSPLSRHTGSFGMGAYTDASAAFLAQAVDLVRPGGWVGLVQPLSVLAARDAGPVRRRVTERGALRALWASPVEVFDAGVHTCAVVVQVGANADRVEVSYGGRTYSVADPGTGWSRLLAPALGVPEVQLAAGGVLGDLGTATADFRDQYYGLVDAVAEGGPGVPLVTSGLIEPGRCLWGTKRTRFAKQSWLRPTVRLENLSAPMRSWAEARLVPKLVIATQSRVLEAAVDVEGAWLPSVPVISFLTDRPWDALAVTLAPPVLAWAMTEYGGTARNPNAVKLSARQVASLPTPVDLRAWAEAARLAEAGDLLGCAEVMDRAYRSDCFDWWSARARL